MNGIKFNQLVPFLRADVDHVIPTVNVNLNRFHLAMFDFFPRISRQFLCKRNRLYCS